MSEETNRICHSLVDRLRVYSITLAVEFETRPYSTLFYSCKGLCLESQGNLGTTKLFTGQRLDATGLYYYNARYYDPTIGRFVSPDTASPDLMNPQSFNKYSYCFNNPLNRTDPTGHWPNWSKIGKAIKNGFQAVVNAVKANPIGALSTIACIAVVAIVAAPLVMAGATLISAAITTGGIATVGAAAVGITAAGVAAVEEAPAFESTILGEAGCGLPEPVEQVAATGRTFWSGGTLAQNAATEYANTIGGNTLGMTQSGQIADYTTNGMNWAQARPILAEASQGFASGAAGDVNVFINLARYTSDSIWNTIERPALINYSDVINIIYHYVGNMIPGP